MLENSYYFSIWWLVQVITLAVKKKKKSGKKSSCESHYACELFTFRQGFAIDLIRKSFFPMEGSL